MPAKHNKSKGKETDAPKKTHAAKGKGAAYDQVHELRDAQDRLKEHVPILFAVLSRVNKKNAREWALAFEKGGFTDHWFPVQKEQAMADTCRRLDLKLTQKELDEFYRLQWGYFVRAVADGESITYRDKEIPPYEPFPHPRLPAHGAFGEVDTVNLIADPTKVYARKRLFNFGDDHMKRISEEVKALKNIKHEHAVPFYGSYKFQDSTYLLFELCDLNLRHFFSDPPTWFIRLRPDQKANKLVNWMLDLALCIAQFHRIGGIHRDLKPENILIKGDTIFVADFGLASQKPSVSSNPASVEGTECYKAPEQGAGFMFGRSADVFALGCIFIELVTFGTNINVEWFGHYRQQYGPQTCHLSNHKCFRHNLKLVSSFINTYLKRDDQMGKLIDLIQFEMLSAGPSFRPSAKEIAQRLMVMGNELSFFKKEGCCKDEKPGARVSDHTEKSLLEKMAKLTLAEEDKIDKHGFAGMLGKDCFDN
jgi:serine/threonine protein kinase